MTAATRNPAPAASNGMRPVVTPTATARHAIPVMAIAASTAAAAGIPATASRLTVCVTPS